MTSKEKAEELVDKYQYYVAEKDFFGDNVELKNAKQCALIAVDEILEDHHEDKKCECRNCRWWQEVKQEILKL